MVSASKLSAQTTKTSCSVAQESTLIDKPMPARPLQFAQTPLPRCPCPNGWVPFIRVHLGQRAVRPAQGRSQNTQHQTRQKRRATDAGPRTTAPRKTSIPTTTEQLQLLGRRPHGRLFTIQGHSRELRHAAHGRFVEARPARPTSTRLRSRRARVAPSGGSIVAQTKTHTGTAQAHRAERLEEPWRTLQNARHPRAAGAAMSG